MSLMHRARRFFVFTLATVLALLGYTYFFYTPSGGPKHRHRPPAIPGYQRQRPGEATAPAGSETEDELAHQDSAAPAGLVSKLTVVDPAAARETRLSPDDGSPNFLDPTFLSGLKPGSQAGEDTLFSLSSYESFTPEDLFNLDSNSQSVLTKFETKQEPGIAAPVGESPKGSRIVSHMGQIPDRIIDADVKDAEKTAQENLPPQNPLPVAETAPDLNSSVKTSLRNGWISHLTEQTEEKEQFEERNKEISERLKLLPEEERIRELQTLRLVKGVNVSALLHFLHSHNSRNSLNTKPSLHNNQTTEQQNETKTIAGNEQWMRSDGRTLNPDDNNSWSNRNAGTAGRVGVAKNNTSVVNSGSGPITLLTRPDSCRGCFQVSIPALIDHPSYCSDFGTQTLVLLLITSAPGNEEKRKAIRKSWGEYCQRRTSKYRCLFVVGESASPEQNLRVRSENETFRDLLQFQFAEAYSNLTYKTMASLHWVTTHCPQVDYVMKTDDDMYVNTHLLPVLLQAAPKEGFIGGFCWGTSSPHRDARSKWYVPLASYAQNRLPPMCSGTGYIMSRDVVRKILEASGSVPFFHLEDVYVALCLQKQGIRPVRLTGFSNIRLAYQACQYRHHVLTSHEVPSELLPQYWEEGKNCPGETHSPEKLYQAVPLPTLA